MPSQFSSDALLFPPKIKEIFYHVYDKAKKGQIVRAIIKAPRGGGKSRVIASIELALFELLGFDVINLGGSFRQATKVYSYLTTAFYSDYMKPTLAKTTQIETRKKKGPSIYVLAATEKQTRSPHIGGTNKGGALFVDEECEADDDIVNSAIPVVNTAHPSIIVRSSTFHKAFGTFQECWDFADKMGYVKFQWDIFDVSEKCNDDCQDVFDTVQQKKCQCILWEYCKGKAHTSEGWVPIQEIRQQRRELSHNTFLIELMGERPSSGGLVYSPQGIINSIVPNKFILNPSGPVAIGVDWGFEGQTAIIMVQRQMSEEKKRWVQRVLKAEFYHEVRSEEIFDIIEEMSQDWRIPLYNDKSHPFQNKSLEAMGALVCVISFAKLKDFGINNVKKMMEDGNLEIPEEFSELIGQLKTYRKSTETGKPIKKNDHGVDGLLCALLHFTDEGFGSTPTDKVVDVVDPYHNRRSKTGY